jgi:hypothetical protein
MAKEIETCWPGNGEGCLDPQIPQRRPQRPSLCVRHLGPWKDTRERLSRPRRQGMAHRQGIGETAVRQGSKARHKGPPPSKPCRCSIGERSKRERDRSLSSARNGHTTIPLPMSLPGSLLPRYLLDSTAELRTAALNNPSNAPEGSSPGVRREIIPKRRME